MTQIEGSASPAEATLTIYIMVPGQDVVAAANVFFKDDQETTIETSWSFPNGQAVVAQAEYKPSHE
jgi:hypothetical protein